jgi:hypothetical protein
MLETGDFILKNKSTRNTIILLIAVLLVTSMPLIESAQATEVYGTNEDIKIIDSIKQLNNINPLIKNTVELDVKIQAPAGYSVVDSPTLLEEYIFAGCLVDYDKEKVVDAMWTQWGYWQSTYHDEVITKTTKIPLLYSEGYYQGSITIDNLSYGSHSIVIWARNEKNMLSFYEVHWAAFQETDFTVSDVTPTPSTPILTPTSAPTPTQQPTVTNQSTQTNNNSLSSQVMVLSGVIAGAVIVSIALLIIYRKQNLKRKNNLLLKGV